MHTSAMPPVCENSVLSMNRLILQITPTDTTGEAFEQSIENALDKLVASGSGLDPEDDVCLNFWCSGFWPDPD